jgi:alpha-beta hydrolase superfamily lysophospholipase
MLSGREHWGTPPQIRATLRELSDLEGHLDRLRNQGAAPGGGASLRQQDAVQGGPRARAARPRRAAVDRLKRFLALVESEWKQPTVRPEVGSQLRAPELFASQKAIALLRMGRTPDTVVDHLVHAAGSMNGQAISPRRIFTQHFKPTAESSRSMIVVVPGYLETGRNFYQQIVRWSAAGHDVVVMDQQWAGQTDGAPGSIDRGFGVMRDVAAVAAFAAQLAETLYGSSRRVVLYGNSMGGLGVLGAYLLNRANLVSLSSGSMPREAAVVVQAAFLGASPTLRNRGLKLLARVPRLQQRSLPVVPGLPRLTSDPQVKQLVRHGVALENVKSQVGAFRAVEPDIAFLMELVQRVPPPAGAITMLHAERDPLACFAQVRSFVEAAGSQRVELLSLPGNDHVIEQSPTRFHYAVQAVNAALAALVGDSSPAGDRPLSL